MSAFQSMSITTRSACAPGTERRRSRGPSRDGVITCRRAGAAPGAARHRCRRTRWREGRVKSDGPAALIRGERGRLTILWSCAGRWSCAVDCGERRLPRRAAPFLVLRRLCPTRPVGCENRVNGLRHHRRRTAGGRRRGAWAESDDAVIRCGVTGRCGCSGGESSDERCRRCVPVRALGAKGGVHQCRSSSPVRRRRWP